MFSGASRINTPWQCAVSIGEWCSAFNKLPNAIAKKRAALGARPLWLVRAKVSIPLFRSCRLMVL